MKGRQKKKQKDSFSRSNARHIATVWSFFVIALISGAISLNAYIGNSRESKRLYDNLIAVDAAGGDVEASLAELRGYMYSHMNTTIGGPTGVKPPIQLKGSYDRLVAAENERVATAKASNATLYNTAQQVCEKQVPNGLSGRGRIPCIEEYVTKNAQPEEAKSIPAALYQYDFSSPLWSPDTAGIFMLISGLSFFIFLMRWFTYQQARRHLKQAS